MKNRAVILERVKAERDRICDIAARHGAYNIRIFGSVVRVGRRGAILTF